VAIIQPAATVAIFSVILPFCAVNTGGLPYVVFLYALVPWTLFATSITDMVDSLVLNMNLVSKIYFPREILPAAALLARLLDFAIAGWCWVAHIVLPVATFCYRLDLLALILVTQLALALGLVLWSRLKCVLPRC